MDITDLNDALSSLFADQDGSRESADRLVAFFEQDLGAHFTANKLLDAAGLLERSAGHLRDIARERFESGS